MPEDDLLQIDATSVVTIRSGTAHTPERLRHELRHERSIVLALVERRSKIVTLEIGKEVFHDELISLREELWKLLAVVHGVDEQRRSGKQAVENSSLTIEARLDFGHAPVVRNDEFLDVAGRASDDLY